MSAPRLAAVSAALLSLAAATAAWAAQPPAAPATVAGLYSGPVADAPCAAGARPESVQGRVSSADVASGRASLGYRCNTVQVGRDGHTGGFHVYRYVDAAQHVCAFYDSTLLTPRDVVAQGTRGMGTVVLDMHDPAHPVRTDVLRTPAMDSPHESLRLNARRGLLVAEAGNPASAPGLVDVYDVRADCRHPVLRSTVALGGLGHESGFAPDGRTFWLSSTLTARGGLTAVDLSDPSLPRVLYASTDYVLHGMSLSDDGRTLYAADQGPSSGLRILDVSQVQDRKPDPAVRQLGFVTWPQVSIPQYADPVTIDGHPYAVEMDEYATKNQFSRAPSSGSGVGAGRVIDISDVRAPRVVSNIRLAVHDGAARAAAMDDPGAQAPAQGYAGHYCSVPRRVEPHLLACSAIVSGLRLFDIRNPAKPVEVGYFNPPPREGGVKGVFEGAFAMSGPAWDLAHDTVWYTDGNNGFYAVKLHGAAAAALHGTSPVPTGAPGTR